MTNEGVVAGGESAFQAVLPAAGCKYVDVAAVANSMSSGLRVREGFPGQSLDRAEPGCEMLGARWSSKSPTPD